MSRTASCATPGCARYVPCLHTPLAPPICAACAFWAVRGRPVEFLADHERRDLYLLLPEGDPLVSAPTITVRDFDGTEFATVRLRCLGIPPAQLPVASVKAVLLRVTPGAPLGVNA